MAATYPVAKISCLYDKKSHHSEREGQEMDIPSNPRFEELKLGINQRGVLNPIVLDGKSRVVYGHYRFLAAKALGLKTVPVEFL